MKRYRIIVRTFENRETAPTITHVLHGRTQKEARHLLDAHLEADAFLRACLAGQRYQGRVECSKNEIFFEDSVTGETWPVDDL